uniref:Uncharacterized protein n=1 Tax=Parastrongyloides trichosuri TaxID=131310 RepID=A0A0N4ZR06_PARTI
MDGDNKKNEERKIELMNDVVAQLEKQYLNDDSNKKSKSNCHSFEDSTKIEDEMNKGLFVVLDDAQIISQNQIFLK